MEIQQSTLISIKDLNISVVAINRIYDENCLLHIIHIYV